MKEHNLEEELKEQKKPKEQEKEETLLTISKITLWKVVSGILGILLILSIFTGGFGLSNDSPTGAAVVAPAPSKAAQPTPSIPSARATDMKTLADDDPFLGNEDALVTIIEFSDYECPFCERFYRQTLPSIKSAYIETGKVKFIYRDFPLSFHSQAEQAAIAANCAGEQGKYFQFHDKIFDNGGAGGKSNADYKKWTQEIGLDVPKWEKCTNDPAQKQEIQKDISDGSAAGISGTPGFIINDKLLSGAQPFSAFQQVIEAEIS
ncbi:DsbA family protein [Candidatus Woesearchaeota archaeon]|nr:DsbA family protein [Candidatus Woesearchaeota archaeon]